MPTGQIYPSPTDSTNPRHDLGQAAKDVKLWSVRLDNETLLILYTPHGRAAAGGLRESQSGLSHVISTAKHEV